MGFPVMVKTTSLSWIRARETSPCTLMPMIILYTHHCQCKSCRELFRAPETHFTRVYELMIEISGLAPSQWETSLQSNSVSHWLGANLESALNLMRFPLPFISFYWSYHITIMYVVTAYDEILWPVFVNINLHDDFDMFKVNQMAKL